MDLTKLADDYIAGLVFIVQTKEGVDGAFGTFLKLIPEKVQEMVNGKAVAIYEYLERAMPRSSNGYPCFFSLQWLNAEDWEAFYEIYETKVKK